MSDYDQSYGVFTQEIWSPRITRAFEKKLAAAPFFVDYTDEVSMGGDTIHIPNMSNAFTATAVTATSGAYSYTEVSETTRAITLNQWYQSSYPMTDLQEAQYSKMYNLPGEYLNKMAYSLAKNYDSAILALGASLTSSVGDSATDISATALENAIAIMESNSVPMDEVAFFFHPYAYWKEIVRSPKLYQANTYGDKYKGLDYTPHSELYGIPVIVSSNVPAGTAGTEGGHRNLLVHNHTFVHARANLMGPKTAGARVQKQKTEALRTMHVADIAYGVQKTSTVLGVRIISNN